MPANNSKTRKNERRDLAASKLKDRIYKLSRDFDNAKLEDKKLPKNDEKKGVLVKELKEVLDARLKELKNIESNMK